MFSYTKRCSLVLSITTFGLPLSVSFLIGHTLTFFAMIRGEYKWIVILTSHSCFDKVFAKVFALDTRAKLYFLTGFYADFLTKRRVQNY